MSKTISKETYNDLIEAKENLEEIYHKLKHIMQCVGGWEYERAKAYWLTYLDNLISSSPLMPCSLEDTINELDVEEKCDECNVVLTDEDGEVYCNECIKQKKE